MAPTVKDCIETIVRLLVEGRYDEVVALTRGRRLSVEEIALAIAGYGRQLTMPPETAYDLSDVVAIRGASPGWSIRFPLWTVGEGRSDLTMEVTLNTTPNGCEIQLDDIHVL